MVSHAISAVCEYVFRHETKSEALKIWLTQRKRASALADSIAKRLSELEFRYVTLDLLGFRSGSTNEVLPASQLKIGD